MRELQVRGERNARAGIGTAARLAGALLLAALHVSCTAHTSQIEGERKMTPHPSPQPAAGTPRPVLLQGTVKTFNGLIGRFGQHVVASGKEVYQQPCVYLSFHLVQMRAAGWKDIDFDTLAAVSGASALFGYQPKQFRPKYANLFIGMDRRIAEATGFGHEWVKFEDAEDAWEIIRKTIDTGRCVKGWDWENVLFAGYQDAADADGRKVFAMADGPDTYAKWWTWADFTKWVERMQQWRQCRLGRHTKRVRKVAARTIALRVMKDLVTWSTKPPAAARKHFPKATFGLAGIEAYAADCENVAKYPDWVMCHDINPQWTVRNSTAVYLRRVAEGKTFGRRASKHIAAAAVKYRAAYAAWKRAYDLLGHGATKAQRRSKSRRQGGAALIREALAHETAAVAELKAATLAIPAPRPGGKP